jgi:uncharacterized membrane protein
MQTCKRTAVLLAILAALALLALGDFAVAESTFQVDSTGLQVYRDGLTHIKQSISVDALASSITVELLSNSVENVLAFDTSQMPLDFTIEGTVLTIFTLGEEQIDLEYDTLALTKKEAETWTLSTGSSNSLTVTLPTNATLLYLNQMPSAINTVNNGISLTLASGNWEISYTLPLVAQETSENSETSSVPTDASAPFNPLIVLLIAVAAAVGISAFLLLKRYKKPSVKKVLKSNPQLQPDDQKIIEFLIEKDGKAFEAEIRERFPDMARTSLWRLVRRLERLDIVEINKIGLENQVKLKK